jgi:Family of unknown function (DUF6442)
MRLKKIEKDERTVFIENQSYKYGCAILNFGILIDIIYRSVRFNEASWDLFGLIFLSGLVTTVYQYKQKIFTKNWIKSILILIIITAILSVILTLFIKAL